MLVMVLNDGETFTDVNGCTIVEVPDGDIESIEEFMRTNPTDYVCRFQQVENGAAIYDQDGEEPLAVIVP